MVNCCRNYAITNKIVFLSHHNGEILLASVNKTIRKLILRSRFEFFNILNKYKESEHFCYGFFST